MHTTTPCRRWPVTFALPFCAVAAAVCLAEDAGSVDGTTNDSRHWSPPAIEPGAYDDITAYNIFDPGRAVLAAEAERVPEPDEPDDPGPIEPVVELPPPDPNATLVLVGISVRGASPTAFIEDRATGEIAEINGPGSYAQGTITAITPSQLTYVIDEEQRTIRIGFALTGERPEGAAAQPAAGRTTSPDTSVEPATGESTTPGDGLSDLERRMRERRRNE